VTSPRELGLALQTDKAVGTYAALARTAEDAGFDVVTTFNDLWFQPALPALLEIAKTGYVTVDGQKASDLRASAAIALARIAGPETFPAFKALVDKEEEAQGVFGLALDRMLVAQECAEDVKCYGGKLSDPSWSRAEKAAFAIGFSGNAKDGIPLLLAAMKPITTMSPDHYPVHQAILFSLSRLANKACTACIDALDKQIARDENATRIPGARDLLGETRVTEAVILNKGADEQPVKAGAAPAAEDAAPAAKGKGKPAKSKPAKGGKKKKHK